MLNNLKNINLYFDLTKNKFRTISSQSLEINYSSCIHLNNKIYFLGAFDKTNIFATVMSYDLSLNIWEKKENLVFKRYKPILKKISEEYI